MGKDDLKMTLKDLQKKGFVVPGIGRDGKAAIPAMPAMCTCPTCGEKIPIFVQVQNLTFAVSYPIPKELATRRPRHA